MAGNKLFAYCGEGGYVQTPVLKNKKKKKKETTTANTPEKKNTPLSPYLCPASQVSINAPEMND